MDDSNELFPESSLAINNEAQWISLSDLMTGLMLVFMLVAVAFMVKVEADTAKAKQVAVIYDEMRHQLYEQLNAEFKDDLPKWGAEITNDLTVRFKEPEVLFNMGRDELKPQFKEILKDFFPRYIKIITSDKYQKTIQEIRIEGHTSSVWNGATTEDDAYYKNMELSQSRTRSTLQYVLSIPAVTSKKLWLKKYVTANGLSSSHPILKKDGSENRILSQRVEFRIRTDADAKIATILESMR